MFERDGQGVWSERVFIKAPNTGMGDAFGWEVTLSSDASTLAVSAPSEGSGAMGISGDQLDNSTEGAGAVYVY